jgi:adenylate kinase
MESKKIKSGVSRQIRKKSSESGMLIKRTIPVVAITGTPGCGKTTLAEKVKAQLGNDQFVFLNIADLIKTRKWYSEWDDEMNCSIFDEKLVCRELEKIVEESKGKKGIILEFHSIDFLKRKFIDKVFVLQTDTNCLWQRLEDRKYSEAKIKENVEAEIFMECLHSCQDRFGEDIVECLASNTKNDMKNNIEIIVKYLIKN